jgi:hypothetical protein
MSAEKPQLDEWLGELLMPADGTELSEEQRQLGIPVAQVAVQGLQQLLQEGKVDRVELSFEVVDPDGAITPMEFTFSAEQEQ